MGDPLYRSSIYVMASTGVMAILGFIFWIFVARVFSTENVGIATTLISVMALISNFSLLGFNVSLIRYLPKSSNRDDKINSVFILVILASIISTLIFLIGLKAFSPHLSFLQTNLFYITTFTLFVIGSSLNIIIDSIFIAYRASGNIFVKNTILSLLKLLFPFLFIFLGSYGIFTSVALAILISSLIGSTILLLKYDYHPAFAFNRDVVKEMAVFSGGNYIANFLSLAPTLILPLLIINRLSAEAAAYFYMDMMILGLLTIISGAATQSLLAEGAYDSTQLKLHFTKASKITFLLLIPAVILIILFGNIILHAFGKNYADEAFAFLQIVSVSAIFMSISSLGSSIFKIRHQISALIGMNALSIIFILSFSYLFMSQGLIGIGWGWLLGQALLAILYLIILGREILLKK